MTQIQDRPQTAPAATAEHRLGLSQATALVMGSIIGVGIFSLPYALGSYGPISLVAMALATVGAVALAGMFAGDVPPAPSRRRSLRLCPSRVRQRDRVQQRVVLLDHRLGRQRGHRGRLGLLRRERSSTRAAATVWSILIALVGSVDPGRGEPDRACATWACCSSGPRC